LQLLASFQTEHECVNLLRFIENNNAEPETVIKITSNIDEWLNSLKSALKKGSVLAYSQNEPLSGILGLVNCIRKEPDGDKLKCFFIDDETAPRFDVHNAFYKSQLQLGLVTNVYKNGHWGSYQHLKINENNQVKPQNGHCFANCSVKGDLSTLSWFDGPLNATNFKIPHVRIQYASMNFRDIMVASGKINLDDLFSRIQQQCVMGFEFSGVTDKGRRVMGMALSSGLATHIVDDIDFAPLYDFPDHWSLEEAATVPIVYLTVYLAFFVESQIKKGDSVLIHAGTGGVGLAAIQVAFAYGLEVFSTVGSEEKKKFLLETFPQLKPENIGNSRDTSFEKMVLVATKGRGVDFVLNSLADDKLQASLRCLSVNGTFLEIGKYDIKNKTKIHMGHFEKKINFKAIFLDIKENEVI
jgi:fatty acid synthase, animal type